jgi:hypothetical protein
MRNARSAPTGLALAGIILVSIAGSILVVSGLWTMMARPFQSYRRMEAHVRYGDGGAEYVFSPAKSKRL